MGHDHCRRHHRDILSITSGYVTAPVFTLHWLESFVALFIFIFIDDRSRSQTRELFIASPIDFLRGSGEGRPSSRLHHFA